MKNKKKSPIKAKPLRYEGQSIDEEIEKIINEQILFYLFTIAMTLFFVMIEWMQYYKPTTRAPWFLTILVVPIISIFIYKIYSRFKKLKRLKLGRQGERVVGQYLESLADSDMDIYHDIIGENFNIDHVIISNKGIFVIETKTYSKPVNGQAKIFFDGEDLIIDGVKNNGKAITQVKAGVNHISNILKESTGKDFDPFPVILFPGWFIEGPGNSKGKVWVLNPKAFKTFLSNQKIKFTDEQTSIASYHLSRHIRSL